MKVGQASWTAQGVTFYRALESAKPEGEAAFDDPLAAQFLDSWFAWVVRKRHRRAIARMVIENGAMAVSFHSVVDRTVFIDDCVRGALADGTGQLVLLGAGFDTRAYRLAGPDDTVRVFEADHPDTQRLKIARLRKAIGPLPDNVVFVPVDFEHEKLSDRLPESGYDSSAATLFIWEGVVSYLTPEAVSETVGFIASNSGAGSEVVFTYLLSAAVDAERSDARGFQHNFLKRRGEPHIFSFEGDRVEEFLSQRGLELLEKKSLPMCPPVKGLRRPREWNSHGSVAVARVI